MNRHTGCAQSPLIASCTLSINRAAEVLHSMEKLSQQNLQKQPQLVQQRLGILGDMENKTKKGNALQNILNTINKKKNFLGSSMFSIQNKS